MQLFATLANFSTPGSATTNLNKALKKAKAMGGPAPPEASNEGCARKRKTGMLLTLFTTVLIACLR